MRVDVSRAVRKLRGIRGDMTPEALLGQAADRVVREIDDTFRREGRFGEQWAPLSPGTIEGRRKSSSAPLQDTGRLRQSFVRGQPIRRTRSSVTIGTNLDYAEFHEKGVGPFGPIVPRRAKALTIPSPGGPAKFTKGRLKGKRGYFAKRVAVHPGIPARPMIPTEPRAEMITRAAIVATIERILRKHGAGRRG